MTASLVYVTTTPDEAGRIGKVVVTENLAASVNILPEVRSIYRWEKQIHDQKEALLIAKTSSPRVDELIERIRSLHSYQCPCIVAWRLDAGEATYLDWIKSETAQ
jgi:periplasmic divalent cation tolerance protein